MYPTEPLRDGIAFIEYVVLNKALGDFETDRWSPLGTVKSRMAAFTINMGWNIQVITDHQRNESNWCTSCLRSILSPCNSFAERTRQMGA